MRLIELLGIPGSGKSTLLGLIEAAAADDGEKLWRIGPAGRQAVARKGGDPVTRLVARTAGRWSRSVWRQAASRSSDRVAVLSRAVAERPELAGAVIDANKAHNTSHGADMVMGMMLNHLISFRLAEEALGETDWLLLGEGLAQRVVSLFAAGQDGAELDRYLAAIPVPEILVVLSAPVEVCFERLERAGWTRRIAGRSEDQRRAFLVRAAELVEITAAHLGQAGAKVVRVDSSGSFDAGVAEVVAATRSG